MQENQPKAYAHISLQEAFKWNLNGLYASYWDEFHLLGSTVK